MSAPHDNARRSRLQLFTVLDDSNDGPGGYRAGQTVYVDPEATIEIGRDVMVTLPGGHQLGRLQEDAEGRYLLLLNLALAERMVRLPPGTPHRGVVIGVFTPRGGDEGVQVAAAAPDQHPGTMCCAVGQVRSDGAYVLRLTDDSMHPGLKRGRHVVVEPGGRCVPGEYVELRLRNGCRLVRELVTQDAAEVVVEAVNGNVRCTIARADIEAMHPVTALVSRSAVVEAFGGADAGEAGR